MVKEFELSQDDMTVLCMALSSYMDELKERRKRTDYYCRTYSTEKYKQVAEENRVRIACRMKHTQDLMDLFLLEMSPS